MAYANMTLGQMFPPLTQIGFGDNCTTFGRWFTSYAQVDRVDPKTRNGANMYYTIDYMRWSMPDWWWQKDYIVDQTDVQLANNMLAWFNWQTLSAYQDDGTYDWTFVDATIYKPAELCPAEYCRAIGWTGNNDVNGIGVMTMYYIESILATLYLVAFTARQTRHYFTKKAALRAQAADIERKGPTRVRNKTWVHVASNRLLDSFRGSLDEFLKTAMLMSIAMLVATIYISVNKIQERATPEDEQRVISGSAMYDLILALMASCYSVFPVMVIYALMRHPDSHQEGARLRWIRRILLFILWALAATVIYLTPRGEVGYNDRHSANLTQDHCDLRGGMSYWHGLKAAQFLIIGLPLLWLFITIFLLTGFKIPGVVNSNFVRRWREGWRLTIAWVNLLGGWALLGFLTDFRGRIKDSAGDDDTTSDWGFGQVVAVAAFVPVVAEFLYILFFGIVDGLSGHLPYGFKITQFEPADLEFYYPDKPSDGGMSSGGQAAAVVPPSDAKTPLMQVAGGGITPSPIPTPNSAPPPPSSLYNPPAAPPSSASYFLPVLTPDMTTQPGVATTTVGAAAAPVPTGFETAYDPGALQQQQSQPLQAAAAVATVPAYQHSHHIPHPWHDHNDPQWQQRHAQQQQAHQQYHQGGW